MSLLSAVTIPEILRNRFVLLPTGLTSGLRLLVVITFVGVVQVSDHLLFPNLMSSSSSKRYSETVNRSCTQKRLKVTAEKVIKDRNP